LKGARGTTKAKRGRQRASGAFVAAAKPARQRRVQRLPNSTSEGIQKPSRARRSSATDAPPPPGADQGHYQLSGSAAMTMAPPLSNDDPHAGSTVVRDRKNEDAQSRPLAPKRKRAHDSPNELDQTMHTNSRSL